MEPQLDRVSLVTRQQTFGNAMKAKRDRLKPRSRNLAGACKSLVADLETGFDKMGPQASKHSRCCADIVRDKRRKIEMQRRMRRAAGGI